MCFLEGTMNYICVSLFALILQLCQASSSCGNWTLQFASLPYTMFNCSASDYGYVDLIPPIDLRGSITLSRIELNLCRGWKVPVDAKLFLKEPGSANSSDIHRCISENGSSYWTENFTCRENKFGFIRIGFPGGRTGRIQSVSFLTNLENCSITQFMKSGHTASTWSMFVILFILLSLFIIIVAVSPLLKDRARRHFRNKQSALRQEPVTFKGLLNAQNQEPGSVHNDQSTPHIYEEIDGHLEVHMPTTVVQEHLYLEPIHVEDFSTSAFADIET